MATSADFRILVGKVVVVTGSTSGLGKATAIEAGRQGAKVVVSGRREAEGLAVVKEITGSGGDAIFVQSDVTKEEDVQRLVAKTVTKYDRIDGAFLNAGTSAAPANIIDTDLSAWDQVQLTNNTSMFLTLKAVMKQMGSQTPQGGSIVLCSSALSFVAFPGAGAYSSTKAANETLGRVAAAEGATLGIRVNVVHPGPIETEIWGHMGITKEVADAVFPSATMLQRTGRAIEIAKPVAFLLSDGSSYMTGSSIVVDGGFAAK